MDTLQNPLILACKAYAQSLGVSEKGSTDVVEIHNGVKNMYLEMLFSFLTEGQDIEIIPTDKPVEGINLEKEYKLCICFGGGTDSTVAAYDALEKYDKKDILLLWVDFGQEYSEKEARAADFIRGEGFNVLKIKSKLPERDKSWGYIVPGRNLFLASIGSHYSDLVWIVATKRDPGANAVSDKSEYFFEIGSKAFSTFYNSCVVIDTPFSDITRTQEIALLIKLVGMQEAQRILAQTNTCYHPTKVFCGACKSCYKRAISMELNNIYEPYEIDPFTTDYFWKTGFKKELSYGEERFNDLTNLLQKRIRQGIRGDNLSQDFERLEQTISQSNFSKN